MTTAEECRAPCGSPVAGVTAPNEAGTLGQPASKRSAIPSRPRLSFIVPVNREDVLAQNVLRSRIYREGQHQFVFQRGYTNISRAYNEARGQCLGEVLVYCHQDVYFPGDWEEHFLAALQAVTRLDPAWGVLGSCGVQLVRRPLLGWGSRFRGDLRSGVAGGALVLDYRSPGALPCEVDTLDEQLLAVRRELADFDEEIPNNHFYGADLCLRCAQQGRKSYAIGAYLHHNSDSAWVGPGFYRAAEYMFVKHRARLPLATTCVIIEDRGGRPVFRTDWPALLALGIRSFFNPRKWRRVPPPAKHPLPAPPGWPGPAMPAAFTGIRPERAPGTIRLPVVSDEASEADRPARGIAPAFGEQSLEVGMTGPGMPQSGAETVADMIAGWALVGKDAIAVEGERGSLTYAALVQGASRLAARLVSSGVRRGDRVGLLADRSPEAIVAMLAVHQAGAAYVPLDPTYPRERLAHMVADAEIEFLLSSRCLLAEVPGRPRHVLPIDDETQWGAQGKNDRIGSHGREGAEFSGHSLTVEAPACNGQDLPWHRAQNAVGEAGELPGPQPGGLAYVIYTSGSTGVPKGVAVEQSSLANLARALRVRYRLGPGDRVLQFTSFSFDISVEEIFSCLASGATLVLRPGKILDSFPAFVRACHRLGITLLNIPTAFWHSLTAALTPDEADLLAATVRLVVIGGEAANAEHLRAWKGKLGARIRLLNAYGPTECTVTATVWDAQAYFAAPGLETLPSVPIGEPLENVTTHVLDEALNPVPEGGVGELCVGGAGVARGYLNLPELTASRFVADPYSQTLGARLYRTGDLARRLPDGNLVCLGRVDNQVKIRGHRIEPGEVEAAMLAHPAVGEAVVAARTVGGTLQLAGYVVPRGGGEVNAEDLRRFLLTRLPLAMVPAALVTLACLPLTPGGKVDRGALPDPVVNRAVTEAVSLTEMEQQVARAFACVLGHSNLSAADDFFALGGDSLKALEVVLELERGLGREVPVRLLLEQPSVSHLAARLANEAASPATRPEAPVLWTEKACHMRRTLSVCTLRDWNNALSGRAPEPDLLPVVLELRGRLEVPVLAAALNEIVRRHETLRLTVPPPRRILAWRPLWPLFRWLAENPLLQRRMSRRWEEEDSRASEPFVPLDPHHRLMRPVEELELAVEEADGGPLGVGRGTWPPALERFLQAPFSLTTGPLLRARLFRIAPEEHVLAVVFSHWVADGESIPVFIAELTALYDAFRKGEGSPLAPLPVQFSDHLSRLAGQAGIAKAAWQARFARLGDDPGLPLPFWRSEKPAPDCLQRVGEELLCLGAVTREALRRHASARQSTPYMVCAATLGALCRIYTRRNQVPVWSPLAGRSGPGTAGLIANLVIPAPLLADCSGDPSFRELLARVRRETLDLLGHPAISMATWFSIMLGMAVRPDAQGPIMEAPGVFFDYWPYRPPRRLEGLDVTETPVFAPVVSHQVEIIARELPERLEFRFRYSLGRYHQAGVRRMASDFGLLLEAALADDGQRLTDLGRLLQTGTQHAEDETDVV